MWGLKGQKYRLRFLSHPGRAALKSIQSMQWRIDGDALAPYVAFTFILVPIQIILSIHVVVVLCQINFQLIQQKHAWGRCILSIYRLIMDKLLLFGKDVLENRKTKSTDYTNTASFISCPRTSSCLCAKRFFPRRPCTTGRQVVQFWDMC